MKKALLVIALTVLLIVGAMVKIYMDAVKDYNQYENIYSQLVQQETDLSVIRFERYHGDQLVHIATAEDDHGEIYYVFMADGAETIHESDIVAWRDIRISQSEAQQHMHERAEQATVLRTIPARIANRPAWEIIAREKNDSLHYVYVDMQSGTTIKAYTLLSSGN